MTYRAMCKYYGIRPLRNNEENMLTDNEKIIRQCKVDIVDMCLHMRKAIDIMEAMAKEIKEIDDKEYSDTMIEFRRRVREIREAMGDVIVRD